MKATELINKFKQILTLSTEEVIDEATTVEETVVETVEETVELAKDNDSLEAPEVEGEDDVQGPPAPAGFGDDDNNEEDSNDDDNDSSDEDTDEVDGPPAPNGFGDDDEPTDSPEEGEEVKPESKPEKPVEGDDVPSGPEFELSKEDSTEVEENEVTELAEEGDDTEDVVEDIQEAKEEIKYASAEELAGLKAEINALAEMLNNLNPKKDVPQELSAEDIKEEQDTAEGISVSPEADVVENKRPLAVKSGLKNASTKDVVWNKLFGN